MMENNVDLYNKALMKWGNQFQCMMVMEECAELQKVVSKYNRNKAHELDVIEEIADVEIMLGQLKLILAGSKKYLPNIAEEVDKVKKEKLNRLKKILSNNKWNH